MQQTEQGACLKPLTELQEQVGQAVERLSAGEDLTALRMLIQTKVYIRKAVVSIIIKCLQQKLRANNWSDQESIERDLTDIFQLVEFTLTTLCPECKHQIYMELNR